METRRGSNRVEISTESAIRLNIGSGNKKIEGWIGIDLDGDPDIRADIRALPFSDEYAHEAMAIHVIEHIWRWEALDVLREWFRVLQPGGKLVLELPDLMKCAQSILTHPDPRRGVWGLYGDPGYRSELMSHKWGWTQSELKSELLAAGFTKIKVRDPQFHGRRNYRDMRLEAYK